MNSIKRVAATGLSAVAVSVLIGGGAASACSMHGSSDDDQGSDGWSGQTTGYHSEDQGSDQQARTEWQAKLDAALREHAAVGVAALKATALAEPDAAALTAAVNQNSMTISDLVDQGYPGTHDEFLALWQAHLGYYNEYLTAAAAHDDAGKQQAKDKLSMFAEQVSELLRENSEGQLDQAALQESLATHGDQVTAIIDNFINANYDAAWTTAHEAYEHMGMVASMLAESANHEDHNNTQS